MADFADLTAWQILTLLRAARAGDRQAFEKLHAHYLPFVVALTKGFFLPGADDDDLRQEADIGFYKAVHDYRANRGATFKTFLVLCVTRQVVTAVKTATRGKHGPLTDSTRIAYTDEGQEVSVLDLLPSPYGLDPYRVLEARERLVALLARIAELTDVERESVLGIAAGIPYKQLSHLGGHKRIDNAAQRARAKLRAA